MLFGDEASEMNMNMKPKRSGSEQVPRPLNEKVKEI